MITLELRSNRWTDRSIFEKSKSSESSESFVRNRAGRNRNNEVTKGRRDDQYRGVGGIGTRSVECEDSVRETSPASSRRPARFPESLSGLTGGQAFGGQLIATVDTLFKQLAAACNYHKSRVAGNARCSRLALGPRVFGVKGLARVCVLSSRARRLRPASNPPANKFAGLIRLLCGFHPSLGSVPVKRND